MPLVQSPNYEQIRKTRLAPSISRYGYAYGEEPPELPPENPMEYETPEALQSRYDVPPPPVKPPSALEQLRGLEPPAEPKRNWWQKLASVAAGAAAGYNNADERVRPVDPAAVQSGVAELTMPNEMRQIREYGRRRGELERQAGIEEHMAEQARKQTMAEANMEADRARAAASRATEELRHKQANAPPPLAPLHNVPAGGIAIDRSGKVVYEAPAAPPKLKSTNYRDDKSGTTTTVWTDPQGNEVKRTTEKTPRLPRAESATQGISVRKDNVKKAADRVIFEERSPQSVDQETKLDRALENITNPENYLDLDEIRPEVVSEIQRRKAALKSTKGSAVDQLKKVFGITEPTKTGGSSRKILVTDPKTGNTREFDSLTPGQIADAKRQGYQVKE